jgi:hypothetical protein
MRGIDRVLAVLLLLGAVGGAAAFARQSGSGSTSPSVALAAPPLQHPEAPGTFFIAPRLVSPANVAPAHRVTIPQAAPWTPARAVQPQSPPQPPVAQPPAAPPAPAPVEAPPAPIQTPAPAAEPPRVLATAAAPAAEGKSKGNGHGHAWGRLKHDDSAPAPEAPVAPTDVPVVPPSQDDPSGDVHGNGNDGHGNDNGNDSGNDHGHGSGNDQSGGGQGSGD